MESANPAPAAARSRMLPALVVGAAAFMQAFDSSAIAVALPTMAQSFGVPALSLNLVITAYLIGATAFLPVCGWAADRFGARRVFQIAIIGFGLSSLICALATNLMALIIARTLEGCMGALLLPVGRVIVLRSVRREETIRAISFLTMPVMLGPLLGPPVGGLILMLGSWRWLFICNVIAAICGMIAVRRYLTEIPGENPRPLDIKGFALLSGALVGTTYGIGETARGGSDPLLIALLIGGGALCAVSYWFYSHRVAHPILDLSPLRFPALAIANIGGLFPRMLVSAIPFLLALLFQLSFGLTPAAAGGLIFANALGSIIGRWLLAPAVTYLGFKRLLLINGILLAILIAGCAFFDADTPRSLVMAVLFVQGALRSLQLLGLVTLSYADIPDRDMNSASTIASVSQQFALSLGIAASVVTLQLAQDYLGLTSLTHAAIAPSFLVLALLSLLSIFWFRRLDPMVGNNFVSRRKTVPADALDNDT